MKKPSEFVLKAVLTYKWQFSCFPELSDSFVDVAGWILGAYLQRFHIRLIPFFWLKPCTQHWTGQGGDRLSYQKILLWISTVIHFSIWPLVFITLLKWLRTSLCLGPCISKNKKRLRALIDETFCVEILSLSH